MGIQCGASLGSRRQGDGKVKSSGIGVPRAAACSTVHDTTAGESCVRFTDSCECV